MKATYSQLMSLLEFFKAFAAVSEAWAGLYDHQFHAITFQFSRYKGKQFYELNYFILAAFEEKFVELTQRISVW